MSAAIPCPECGTPDTLIKNSRAHVGGCKRRRVCRGCGHRFTTLEVEIKAAPELLRLARERREKLAATLRFVAGYAEEAAEALESLNVDMEGTGDSGQASGGRQSPNLVTGKDIKEAS